MSISLAPLSAIEKVDFQRRLNRRLDNPVSYLGIASVMPQIREIGRPFRGWGRAQLWEFARAAIFSVEKGASGEEGRGPNRVRRCRLSAGSHLVKVVPARWGD
jgi:hypothetical protein